MICGFLFSFALSGSGLAQGNENSPSASPSPERLAFAVVNPNPGETPYFSAELEPGEREEMMAVVATFNSVDIELRAYVTNTVSATNGGFAAATEQDELASPASWIAFESQTFSLGANDQFQILFAIDVPEQTEPGQYVAAIVAETAEPSAVEGTTLFEVVTRSIIAVEIVVPGERDVSFELGEPELTDDTGSARLIVPITNTGNWRVQPEGALTISSEDGEVVTEAPIAMDSVYANTSTIIEVLLPEQFAPGDYTVHGNLVDPESNFEVDIAETFVTFESSTTAAATPDFVLDPLTITPVGDPVQFADVAITIDNSGEPIPTGKVVLAVSKDGELVEEYVLTQNQAMPQGTSTISQRYIPMTGWESGTYTFAINVYSVDEAGTETVIATVEVEDTIEIP
jgi:hypothetical protein